MDGKRAAREHYCIVHNAEVVGEVTSGTFSPTLQKAIALARIPVEATGSCQVEIRGKQLAARIVRPPFVRDGEPCEGIL